MGNWFVLKVCYLNLIKMSSAHDLAVLSFDLDFLRPTADNIPVAALKKKIINPVKNRIVRVSVLIKHVRGMKNDIANKSDEIELLKSKLEFNTQEFTKLTLEYKDLLENYSKCEKERDDLKTAIKTYTEKYYEAENRVLAGKSHIVQLEHLIKQHERQIDTLKKKDNTKNYKPLKLLKDNLAKELESWKNKYKQERTEWQTKYNTLLKRLQHEKGGTGNLTKNISSNNVNDDIGEHSDIEDDISIGFLSPLTQDPSQNNVSMDQQSSVGSVSVDTGCGSSLASSDNEKWLNSPDYLFSPIHDITNNPSVIGKNIDTATSPISPVKMVDVATSPIAIQPNVNATSPIPSLKIVDVAISPITIQPDNTATCPISPVKIVDVANSPITKLPDNTATGPAPPVKIVDVATSPVTLQPTDTASSPIPGVKIIDVATSPITIQPDDSAASPVPKSCDSAIFPINIQLEPYECCENLSESPTANNISVNCNINDAEVTITNKTVEHAEIESPVKILHELPYQDISELDPDTIVEETIYIDIQEIETKNCLELNNSNNVEEDNSTNYEVETILNTMRLNHSLITPIPTTPTKNASSMHIRTYSHHTQTETPIHYACSDAALAKDQAAAAKEEAAKAIKDNEKRNEYTEGIVANLVSLMKDMINVKTFLKNKFSYSDTEYTQDDNSLPLNKFYENSNFNNDLHTLLNSGDPVQDSIIDRDLSRSPTPLSDIIKIIEPHQHSMENINKIETLHKEMELESPSKQNNLPLETKRVTYSNMSTTKLETKSKTKKPRRGILKKARKLTNLAKYRKKIEVPKYKIRRETPPLRKPRMKPKQILNYGIKKVTRTDTSATLNDKQIYAKAVKVMTELNAKKLMNSTETVLTSTIPKEKAAENIDICQPNILPSMTSPKLVVLVTPLTLAKASPTLQNTASVTEITSPKLQITSPIQKTKSRRRSLRSSKSDILCEDVAVTSPDVGVMSPDVAVTSPDFAVTSSNVAVTSPDAAVPTPNVTITSRKTATSDYLLSPKTTAISAKKSPTPILTSPTASTNYLRRSVRLSSAESPKYVTTPPNLDITSHRTLVTSPKLSVKPYLSATPLSPPVASSEHVRTRSKSHFIKSCTNYGTGIHETQLQRDSSINKSLLENKSRKRTHSNDYDTPTKRVLRSSIKGLNPKEHTTLDDVVNKDDPLAPNLIPIQEDLSSWHPKESILCCMIQKYGITTKRPVFRNVPDTILETICGKIERYMSKFHESLNKDNTMNEMVEEFKPCNYKNFVAGLVKYLTEPDRKMELFGKTSAPPAPQMTKSEAGLLFVIRGLRKHWQPVDIVHVILSSLEYRLFRLNRTPDFDVIESVSHFYALVCRYFGLQSRLKAFMFDAMYFILYKSAPIIKQCLEVWPHIIPLAHMSAAKIPLVTIFVYLLHFYKCDDKSSRVQDIRTILNRRYSYQLTDWNETKLLELVTNSISELRDNPCEKKMLRIAIIILGKRHGPRWTQHNIIKKLFQFIDKETLPVHILEFCISMIGPLMKPYSNDMKVQCEIAINQLMRILDTTTSKRIEEVTISSIVTMSRHSSQRVDELLLSRKMGVMSPALEELIRGYIRTKPLHIWLKLLSRPCVV